ncbi:hypothetical protein J6590_013897 [Homalodisca vitripennis]|nr:hypothetical protein J6590_013897 [Homalodisca vitripennis]
MWPHNAQDAISYQETPIQYDVFEYVARSLSDQSRFIAVLMISFHVGVAGRSLGYLPSPSTGVSHCVIDSSRRVKGENKLFV